MSDLDQRERAQLGLQYIEDSVVNLLTKHSDGMEAGQIADVLGLSVDSPHRDAVAAGILELLVKSGRILWNDATGKYIDNPDRY